MTPKKALGVTFDYCTGKRSLYIDTHRLLNDRHFEWIWSQCLHHLTCIITILSHAHTDMDCKEKATCKVLPLDDETDGCKARRKAG